MGLVIEFPRKGQDKRKRARKAKDKTSETKSSKATVVILPVIRIERYADEPVHTGSSSRQVRRRRRRVARP